MPGKRKFDTRVEAEDLEQKLLEATSLANAISTELDNGTNPEERADAWEQVSQDLFAIFNRVQKLAR